VVYIQEAHPSDLWQLPSNVEDEVIFSSPQTFDERVNVAAACIRDLGIEFPALLDHIEDSTEQAYTGWPDRLYVIDQDGRVAYKSDPGPYGFTPAAMEVALKKVLEGGEPQPPLAMTEAPDRPAAADSGTDPRSHHAASEPRAEERLRREE
jgi:type I thyroxine 5'-deiodinase